MYKWKIEELKLQIGKLFLLYRLRSMLSQLQLANELNLSSNHIGRIERAETNPTLEIIVDYCNFFEVDILTLFTRLSADEMDAILNEINDLKIHNKNKPKK